MIDGQNIPTTIKNYAGYAFADQADVVVNAVVGFAGLDVTIRTLSMGRRLALANKESLIAAGPVPPAVALELVDAVASARREAASAFGDDTVYIEKYLGKPRHIEIQIFGDGKGQAVHLGPTEFRLLRHFMEHPGRVFSREQLLDAVWGKDVYVEARTVDVHIRRLRKAINDGGRPDIIRTVRSAGYALDVGH